MTLITASRLDKECDGMDEGLARGELSLRQLAHFVAVAEDGTISGAAERLIMSSSALSASITELERALGADLLDR
jgi:molybdenum-dependent DNA-binding transcriptional regulator ModE